MNKYRTFNYQKCVFREFRVYDYKQNQYVSEKDGRVYRRGVYICALSPLFPTIAATCHYDLVHRDGSNRLCDLIQQMKAIPEEVEAPNSVYEDIP